MYWLLSLLVAGLLWASPAHAQICQPNPNDNGPPFTGNCPLSATGLNKLGQQQNAYDVIGYGAKGDGVTDDSAAIASAFQACSTAGGGEVIFKPTGNLYVIQQAALVTGQERGPCGWKGIGGHYWPANFYDNNPQHWAAKGPWIWCQDTGNACAELTTPGQSVIGLNFWQTHPTPSSTTCSSPPCAYLAGWTPTTYPPVIKTDPTTNFYKIQDNMIVNAYDCIDIEGPSTGIANMNSLIADNYMGCLHKDFRFNQVDNTLNVDHNHEFLLWYQGSLQVFNYVEGGPGGLGWDVNYLANIQVNGGEIVWKRLGMLLTDGTVTNGFGSLTFAGANWKIHGLEFNEVCQAMAVANSTTHFNGGPVGNAIGLNVFDNIGVSADTNTSGNPGAGNQCAALTPKMFDLGSDNVSVMFNGLNAGYINTLFNVGAGSSGFVTVNGLSVQKYSAFTSALPLFQGGTNAAFELCGGQFRSVGVSSGAGPYTSGGFMVPCSLGGGGQINGPAATQRSLIFGTNLTNPSSTDFGTSYRWGLRTDASAESGSNAGSNFCVDRYADGNSGSTLDSPLCINRATGNMNLNDALVLAQKTVSTLPTCNAGELGAVYLVTDQTGAPAYLGALTGGGTLGVPVVCSNTSGSFRWEAH